MLGGADNPNGELPSYITGADTVSLLKPPVVTAQCSASRSQQSSANVTRSFSPLSQRNSNPSEHHR